LNSVFKLQNMTEKESCGWKKLFEGYPWYNCDNCYPITAYSEFMPPPLVGRKPLGNIDRSLFSDDDPYGWNISEKEEQLELRPGIEHIGHQVMNSIIKLGKGLPEHHIHGHCGQNLEENPYWPSQIGRASCRERVSERV
jgi:hypothetical protein